MELKCTTAFRASGPMTSRKLWQRTHCFVKGFLSTSCVARPLENLLGHSEAYSGFSFEHISQSSRDIGHIINIHNTGLGKADLETQYWLGHTQNVLGPSSRKMSSRQHSVDAAFCRGEGWKSISHRKWTNWDPCLRLKPRLVILRKKRIQETHTNICVSRKAGPKVTWERPERM